LRVGQKLQKNNKAELARNGIINFYERSFSHYFDGGGYGANSRMYIDEDEISYIGSGGGTKYGLLSPMQLSLGIFHTIKISGGSNSFDAIVLIYREA
jgi:hypothetical protein